jgi:hypothetical protein
VVKLDGCYSNHYPCGVSVKCLDITAFGILFGLSGCFGPTSTVGTPGGLAGEGKVCTGIDPSSVVAPIEDLTIEMGQGRTKVGFQPHVNEERLELSQGAQGMAMIVYDLQILGGNISGANLCATIVTTNTFSNIEQDDYIPMQKLAYVLERDDGDYFAGPIYHPFGWNAPADYEAESFRLGLRIFVGDKVGTIQREFELIDGL